MIDWNADLPAQEWKAIAYNFARKWSGNNDLMLVDPAYIHWLSATTKDTKIFNIGDRELRSAYIRHLDGKAA
jgi:hypothetical protein